MASNSSENNVYTFPMSHFSLLEKNLKILDNKENAMLELSIFLILQLDIRLEPSGGNLKHSMRVFLRLFLGVEGGGCDQNAKKKES